DSSVEGPALDDDGVAVGGRVDRGLKVGCVTALADSDGVGRDVSVRGGHGKREWKEQRERQQEGRQDAPGRKRPGAHWAACERSPRILPTMPATATIAATTAIQKPRPKFAVVENWPTMP